MREEKDLNFEAMRTVESFRGLDFDDARVVAGFITDTYILIVSGEKPYLNMDVALVLRIYVRQPEYWGFDIVGSIPGGIGLPAFGRYTAHKDLSGVTGTKGVEVFGTDCSLKIAVPINFEEQMAVLKDKGQLCNQQSDVQYRANQVPGGVIIIAEGSHNTSGYETFFEQSPIDIFPPEFILKFRPSTASCFRLLRRSAFRPRLRRVKKLKPSPFTTRRAHTKFRLTKRRTETKRKFALTANFSH